MIDIHCHILPELDDGSDSIETTVEMARIAYNCGIRGIIATPHCNIPGEDGNYYSESYRSAFQSAVSAIQKAGIPVRLMPGMEVFVTFDVPDLIRDNKIITLNNSSYILTEFDFCEDPEFVEFMVERFLDMKLVPVIAHPERYEFIKYCPELASRLRQMGCVLQANKGSFMGRYGNTSRRIAFMLLEDGLIDVVASDAHTPYIRTPDISRCLNTLKDITDTNLLFNTNPTAICANAPVKRL
ncbi:MAG: hypothetical protein IJD19_02755 [Ruminococcus sp.]|nr:hypothetical protein [Ruminococcus sp.]